MSFLNKIKKSGLYKLIGTDPYDIHYLNKACESFKNCRYLEIGTAYGGSMASVMDTIVKNNGCIVSVDYFGKLLNTPKNVGPNLQDKKNRHSQAQKVVDCVSLSNIVDLHTCGSNDFFKKIDENKKFDVIFIDGDHSYIQSKLDLENSLKHLSDNGIIIMDDIKVITQKLNKNYSVYRTFHEYKGRKDLYKNMGIIYGKSNNTKLLD